MKRLTALMQTALNYSVMYSRHHEDRISDFETDNSYLGSGHYCMQGDLIVRSQSHEQFAG